MDAQLGDVPSSSPGHFFSGSGFKPPSLMRHCLVGTWLAMLKVLTRVEQVRLCMTGRDDKVGSPQLRSLFNLLRMARADWADLDAFRSMWLGCVSPSLSGVEWHYVVFGGVPGWCCTPSSSTSFGLKGVPTCLRGDARTPCLGGCPSQASLGGGYCLVVYVHGGGLASGDAGCFQGIVSRLAVGAGRCVWVPHYRLCPEVSRVEAIADCVAFVSALAQAGADTYPTGEVLPSVVIVGDSAGGHVAHGAAQHPSLAGVLEHLVLLSPMLGVTPLDALPMLELEKQDRDVCTTRATLRWLYGMAGIPETGLSVLEEATASAESWRGVAPYAARKVTVYAATDELLFPDAQEYAKALRALGSIEVNTRFVGGYHFHAWPTLAGLGVPECDATLQEIAQIVHDSDRR